MNRRWLYVLGPVLLVSLGLNLFLGGFLAARWMHWGPGDHKGGRHFERELALEVLEPGQKKLVKEIWRDHKDEHKALIRQVREARRRLQEVLTAEVLDPDALKAAQESVEDRWLAARRAMADMTLRIAETLPDDERRKFFEAGRDGRKGKRD